MFVVCLLLTSCTVKESWYLSVASLARIGLNCAFGSGPAGSQQFPLRDRAAQHHLNETLLM